MRSFQKDNIAHDCPPVAAAETAPSYCRDLMASNPEAPAQSLQTGMRERQCNLPRSRHRGWKPPARQKAAPCLGMLRRFRHRDRAVRFDAGPFRQQGRAEAARRPAKSRFPRHRSGANENALPQRGETGSRLLRLCLPPGACRATARDNVRPRGEAGAPGPHEPALQAGTGHGNREAARSLKSTPRSFIPALCMTPPPLPYQIRLIISEVPPQRDAGRGALPPGSEALNRFWYQSRLIRRCRHEKGPASRGPPRKIGWRSTPAICRPFGGRAWRRSTARGAGTRSSRTRRLCVSVRRSKSEDQNHRHDTDKLLQIHPPASCVLTATRRWNGGREARFRRSGSPARLIFAPV